MSCMGLLCVIYMIFLRGVIFRVFIHRYHHVPHRSNMTMKLLSESGHKFLEIAQSDSSQILMMSYS